MDTRDNLRKLADYLAKLPDDYEAFEMNTFFAKSLFAVTEPDVERRYGLHNGGVDKCGAVACAVGHGPSAGLLVPEDARFWHGPCRINWDRYVDHFLLPGYYAADPAEGEYCDFAWMFGGDWSDVDNTPAGAAKRIRYWLEHGHPFDDGWPDITDDLVALYQNY